MITQFAFGKPKVAAATVLSSTRIRFKSHFSLSFSVFFQTTYHIICLLCCQCDPYVVFIFHFLWHMNFCNCLYHVTNKWKLNFWCWVWFCLFICLMWCAQHVNRLEITPDKHYLAAAGNPHIRLFDVNSNTPQPVCHFHNYYYMFYLSKKV